MPSWTHLIRFIATEDHEVHLGQLVDTTQDVGLSSLNNIEIKAYLIHGTIFNNVVTNHILTVKQVSSLETYKKQMLTGSQASGTSYKGGLQLHPLFGTELL